MTANLGRVFIPPPHAAFSISEIRMHLPADKCISRGGRSFTRLSPPHPSSSPKLKLANVTLVCYGRLLVVVTATAALISLCSVMMCLLRSSHLDRRTRACSVTSSGNRVRFSRLCCLQPGPVQSLCWSEFGCQWQLELCSPFLLAEGR